MSLNHSVDVHSSLKYLIVMGNLVQFRKAVDGKALGVELFLGIQPGAVGIHRPVDATVFMVAEMGQEPVFGVDCGQQVLFVRDGLVCGCK